MKQALIIVDMQNDFVHPDGAEPISGSERKRTVENIVQLLSWAREKGIPVIFTQDTHTEDQDFEARGMIKHGIKDSWGWKIIDELLPIKDIDIIIEKDAYSGFVYTKLDDILKSKNIEQVIIVGVYTYICVQSTVIDAYQRGFDIVLFEDCMTADNQEKHQRAIYVMEDLCHTKVRKMKEDKNIS